MTALTDPAKDIANLCERLNSQSPLAGDQYFAAAFQVDVWSKEFYFIIFCILDRIHDLITIISNSEQMKEDSDLQKAAIANLVTIKQAFQRDSLTNLWVHHGSKFLSAEHVRPIKMLSYAIRNEFSYPSLDQNESLEILNSVDVLTTWLSERQLLEQDFIRQSILDGLEQFKFRLKHIGWIGWGYTIDALREVISAYLILEGMDINSNTSPNVADTMSKIYDFVKNIFEKTESAKKIYEASEFMVKAYGLARLSIEGGQKISGLITHIQN